MSEDDAWGMYLAHIRSRILHRSGPEAAGGGGRWTSGIRIFNGRTQAEADRKRNAYERRVAS